MALADGTGDGSRTRRYLPVVILILCIIETIFMSGILYGWNGLVPIWTALGVYGCQSNASRVTASYVNSNSSTPPTQLLRKPCASQSSNLAMAFIVTSSSQFIFTLPCGMLFDRFGLLISKLVNGVFFLIACIFLAFVSSSTPGLLYPAGLILSLAAPFVLLCNFQIGKLFPKWSNLIIAIISGSFDSSSAVFQFIAFGYAVGVSLTVSFLILGGAGLVLMFFIGIALFPKMEGLTNRMTTKVPADPADPAETQEMMQMEAENNNVGENKDESTSESPPPSTWKQVMNIMRTRHYILQVIWFSCILLRFQFFLTAMNNHVKLRFPDGGNAPGRVFMALGLFLFGGVFFAPFAGFSTDFITRKLTPASINIGAGKLSAEEETTMKEISLRAIGIGESISSIAGILLTVLIYISGEAIFYVLFFLEAFMRAFLFSLNGSFSAVFYPGPLFGKLFGIMFLIGGILSSIQFALMQLPFDYSNGVLIIVCIVSLVQPINLIMGSKGCCK